MGRSWGPGQWYGLILSFKRLQDEPKWFRQKLKKNEEQMLLARRLLQKDKSTKDKSLC